jgi:hypothetical protein
MMPGPEYHSKKPKAVTIDLTANADAAKMAEPEAAPGDTAENVNEEIAEPVSKAETIAAPSSHPSSTSASSSSASKRSDNSSEGFFGKLVAGILGGVIALAGGAGLQTAGYLPSFGGAAELATLKAQVEKLAAAPAAAAIDPPALAALGSAQDELTRKVDALTAGGASAAGAAALSALQDRIAALETEMAKGASGAAADQTQVQAFKDLTAKVTALEASSPAANGSAAVALAIAASGLKAAIDRGGPFMAELETYATVAPASPDVEALRTLAASGVPSRQDLINGFSAAANAMLSASQAPDPNAGVFSRLADSAKNLVKARPVGDIPGDSPEALVARMEVALGRGDLDAVLTEAAKLPVEAKTAGAAYLDLVKARRDTDGLVTKALSLALAAAGGKS